VIAMALSYRTGSKAVQKPRLTRQSDIRVFKSNDLVMSRSNSRGNDSKSIASIVKGVMSEGCQWDRDGRGGVRRLRRKSGGLFVNPSQFYEWNSYTDIYHIRCSVVMATAVPSCVIALDRSRVILHTYGAIFVEPVLSSRIEVTCSRTSLPHRAPVIQTT
jgi:hypothetical protein